MDAEGWLAAERRLITAEAWQPPGGRGKPPDHGITLAEYAPSAIRARRVRGRPLSPRTTEHYLRLLNRVILPGLGHLPVDGITEGDVMGWYDALDPGKGTQRAHSYALLKQTLAQRIRETKATRSNPCAIEGAAISPRRKHKVAAIDGEAVARLARAMPPRLEALVLLCGWAGLRFGEVTELRRRDVDISRGVVRVERAVAWVGMSPIVKEPKTSAGIRDVDLPPHIVEAIASHLERYVGAESRSLLFPATEGGDEHWRHGPFYRLFDVARRDAGLPDLRLHDLRHASAISAAQAGATLGELMQRLGHSTVAAALVYQSAASGRGPQIAQRMSEQVGRQSQ